MNLSKYKMFRNLSLMAAITAPLMAGTTFAQQTNTNENNQQQSSDPIVTAPVLSQFSLQLQSELKLQSGLVKGKANKKRIQEMTGFYEDNNFDPLWVKDNQATQKAINALKVLEQAAIHGLNPNDYETELLNSLTENPNEPNLLDFEIRMTRSVLAYAQHLNAGRLDPQAVNREIVVFPEAANARKILDKLRITQSIQAYLAFMAPYTPRYERLRIALANYKILEKKGPWTLVDKGDVLKPGMTDQRVPSLRQRMFEDGSLKDRNVLPEHTEFYDDALVEAVKKFQFRHGLEQDGVVGPQTLTEINTTIKQRITTLKVNLERRRWMQNNYGRYYVFANLADQVIKLVRDEKNLHFELIQVGKPYHRTPVFSDQMNHIIINPYWNVPYSIATKEYLPKLKSNPGALVSQNIKVLAGGSVVSPYSIPWQSYSRRHFPVRLRQDSGPKNALGRIKFMFPNKFNVYIHDTPSKSKFNKISRYFSHGCLRLRDPLTMAEKILKSQGWSRAKIDATVKSGKRTVVKLKEKIPVHITYLTAWANKDGSVHFRRDIYGRDKILDTALKKASKS